MNEEEYEKLFKFSIKTAKKTLKKFKNHQPLFILFDDKPELTFAWVELKDDKSKDIMANNIRNLIKEKKAIGYLAINEGWYLGGDLAKFHNLNTPIRNHPQRQECVNIMMVTKEHKKDRMAVLPFIRENDEIIILEKEIHNEKGLKLGGRFGELMEEEK